MTVIQANLDTLHSLLTAEPLVVVNNHFGETGVTRAKGILRFLKKCARHSTVDEKSHLKVFTLMKSDSRVDTLRISNAKAFQFGVTALGSIRDLTVEIREDGSPFVWHCIPSEIAGTLDEGIVYRLLQGVENFLVCGSTIPVPKVIDGAISQFVLNYFTDLKQALLAYRDSMAKTSKCHLLRQAWADKNRLWFVNSPEFRLRRALHNYLYSYLRCDDIDLREEQNVNDKNPVDLKIVWRMDNRSAIIEVKWVGKSLDLSTGNVTAEYYDSRAREGAKQLAEYLEEHRQEASREDTRGYLVVFDCRRKRLSPSATSVSRADGFHYQDREIEYNPRFHETRLDFEEPIRMFLEPVCV
jgi:hypothetical protein